MTNPHTLTILIAGATRGLGLGLVRAFLAHGWQVIATARDPRKADALDALQRDNADRLSIETLDVADPASIKALAPRLGQRKIDVLFVVAGVISQRETPLQELAPDAVAHEFATNAIGPVSLARWKRIRALSPGWM